MFSPWWNKSSLVTFYLLFILQSSLLHISQAQQACAKIEIRREWSTLSTTQKGNYLTALVSYIKNKGKEYQGFGDKHYNLAVAPTLRIHGSYLFLPWHRYFCREFELKLKAIDSSITLPYWDASRTPNTFSQNAVFDTSAFGSAGGIRVGCIKDGKLKDIKLPNGVCVAKRGGFSSDTDRIVDSTAVMNSAINLAKTFSQISESLEYGYHGDVHINCGGNMRDMTSPYDPLFFLHHCNIDRFWALWQKKNELSTKAAFEDVKRFSGDRQTINTKILGYETITLGQVMKTRNLCYAYIDTATDAEIKANGGLNPNVKLRKRNYSVPELPKIGHGLHLVEPGVLSLGEVAHAANPKALPEDWIKMNHLDAGKAREHEKWRSEVIGRLNSVPGYVRGSSVVYKREYLKKILESYKNLSKVTFYARGKKLQISVAESCDETVERVIAAFNHENSRYPKPRKEALISIIGPSVYNDKVTTINPFRSCAT